MNNNIISNIDILTGAASKCTLRQPPPTPAEDLPPADNCSSSNPEQIHKLMASATSKPPEVPPPAEKRKKRRRLLHSGCIWRVVSNQQHILRGATGL